MTVSQEVNPKSCAVDQIVGPISDATKQNLWDEMNRRFSYHREQPYLCLDWRQKEIPKTPEQIYMVDLANQSTNNLLMKLGLNPLTVPLENIYVINGAPVPGRPLKGFSDNIAQAVALTDEPGNLRFMIRLQHEMIHFKSYFAIHAAIAEGRGVLNGYRMSYMWGDIKSQQPRFTWFMEAVTESINREMCLGLKDHPLFRDEVSEAQSRLDDLVKRMGMSHIPWGESDIYEVELEDNEEMVLKRFGYGRERQQLERLVGKLAARNLVSPDKIKQGLVRDNFTGNLLYLGRFFERGFGKGTMRKLALLGDDMDKVESFIQAI